MVFRAVIIFYMVFSLFIRKHSSHFCYDIYYYYYYISIIIIKYIMFSLIAITLT